MSDSNAPNEPVVYQLSVVLRDVSPLIWRRLLVRSDANMAELHATFQTALGWSDENLHRSVIHGRAYGEDGCAVPQRVRLADLSLRVRERFLYDFTDAWQHDVRVEQLLRLEPGRLYPRCVGGRRRVPPEDCGGPWAFLELRQRYCLLNIADRLYELAKRRLDISGEAFVHDYYEDVLQLQRWLEIDRCDRREVNRRLTELTVASTVRAASGCACRSSSKPMTTLRPPCTR